VVTVRPQSRLLQEVKVTQDAQFTLCFSLYIREGVVTAEQLENNFKHQNVGKTSINLIENG